MAEIDPVILELRADLGKYRADLQSTTSQVQRLLGRQERDAQRLEKQMLKSSTAISGALRNIGASLGSYFTGREIVGLIDNFTRLQNALNVAGLEGADLARVQASLLEMSGRYGVSVNELADLFGKATQAGSDLGASQAQLLQITEASAQALKITGTSAVQAQGALLGLTQALSSGIVRAEEFNQINEGGLRPLLQVAANAEKYGGSVAKLRMAVVDGKVTSQEFYQSILAGSAELEGRASKAALTLAGAFEALTSRLTVYIGESAKANGVTQALAGGLQMLAENLDKIIPALAVIGTMLAGRFIAGALGGGAALKTLAAYASIATTSLAGTALAARSAGAAMLAAFGGPVGLAITALVLGVGYLVAETRAASDAAKQAELQAIRTTSAMEAEKKATDLLAAAKGAEKKAQIDATKASRDRAAQALQTAKALQAEAKAALVAARAQAQQTFEKSAGDTGFLATFGRALGGAGGAGPTITPGTAQANNLDRRANAAEVELERANKAIAELEGQVDGLTAVIGDGAAVPKLAPASGDGKKKKKKGATGPSPADIEDRFQSELASITQQTLSARQALATSAEERAELELRGVEAARVETLRSLEADKDYSDAQKARVRDALENLADFERERVARDLRVQKEEELADLADTEFRARSDALRQQYDLAKSQAERRKLAFEIIDLEYSERDAALERVKSNKDLSDAVRQRAEIEQAALRAARGRTEEAARRDTAGPLEQYMDRAKLDADELNEAFQGVAVDGLQSLNDGLTEAIMGSKSLGDVFKNVAKSIIADLIRVAIQQTIVNSLMSAIGGGSGGGSSGGEIGAAIGSIFGRASGGYVAPGQTVRVNEHAGGAEYLRMGSQGGHVIPLGQVNQQAARPAAQGGGVVRLMIEEAPGFASTVRAQAQGVAIEVVKSAAPGIAQMGANEAQRAMARPSMGRGF